MALTVCTECGTQISDRAAMCIKCGAPLPAMTWKQIQSIGVRMRLAHSARFGGMLFLAGVLWLGFAGASGGAQGFAAAWGSAIWLILAGAAWYMLAEVLRNLHERHMNKAGSTAARR
jgi:hypothetical protein